MIITQCMVPEIWSATGRIFCQSRLFFALLPPYAPRKSKFWKNEKNTWRYYHFTHVHHKWQSYDLWFLRYQLWQTEFLVILDRLLCFYPLTARKMKISKKWIQNLEISSFYTLVPKIMIICYTAPEIWCVTNGIIFHFGLSFTLPKSPKNQNFKEMKINPGDIIILHMCTKNYDQMMYGSWDMMREGWIGRRADKQTDGKSDI